MSRIESYNRQPNNNLLITAVGFFILALTTIYLVGQFTRGSNINSYIILLGLLFLIILPVILYAAVKGLDVFEPIYIIALTYLQIFVIAPWVWLVQGRTTWMGFPIMDGLPYGSMYFALGYFTFLLGYCFKHKSSVNELENVPDINEHLRRLVVKISVVLLTIAFIGSILSKYLAGRSLLFTLTLGRVKDETAVNLVNTDSPQLLFLTMFINVLIPAFMLLYVFQRKYRWLLVPVFTIILIFSLSSAFRYRILVLLFAPILFNYLIKGKRPRLSSCLMLVVAVFFIVTVVGAWRNNIRSGTELISLNWDILIKSYMPNVEIFYSYYRILDIIPEFYPHTLGKGYLYTFTILIPRALWPGKPYSPIRDILILAFGEQGMMSGPAYPNVGEFYIEFGVAGILIGMYLFGCFARWTHSLYKSKQKGMFSIITYSMLFPFFLQIVCRGYFPQIFLEALFTFGPVFGVAFIVNRVAAGQKQLKA